MLGLMLALAGVAVLFLLLLAFNPPAKPGDE
jgi:hypothetical protein